MGFCKVFLLVAIQITEYESEPINLSTWADFGGKKLYRINRRFAQTIRMLF